MNAKIQIYLILSLIIMSNSACTKKTVKQEFTDNLSVSWELKSNFISEDQECQAVFEFENKGDSTIKPGNWKMYFNQVTLKIVPPENPEKGVVEHVNGDLYRFIPGPRFELKPNNKISIEYKMHGCIISESYGPSGLYFVINENEKNQKIELVQNFQILPFERKKQMHRNKADMFPLATPDYCYNKNLKISTIPETEVKRIIPSPYSMLEGKGKYKFSSGTKIYYEKKLENEAKYLQSFLSKSLNSNVLISEGIHADKNGILLKISPLKINNIEKETYHLTVNEHSGIHIEGTDAAGVFHGIQSLLALLPLEVHQNPQAQFEINETEVKDAPRFSYRGIMIDLSRHFHSKASIMKMIDLFAFYKLNFLQLLLSDDEGWRLEIPGLPELTEVGSRRGHITKGYDYLFPNFGIGPFPDKPDAYGDGFFTRGDFMEILKYAKGRHITIVPEFCVPGHARAAIMSMENRYEKYMKEGKKELALEYRLRDENDTSRYLSAQYYNDNIVCIGLESVYHFYEKVIDEIYSMYKEAGVPFEYFHTGGDEVPNGSWIGSPFCKKIIDENPNAGTLDLQAVFFKRVLKMLEKYNVNICGWEEIAMLKDKSGKIYANPEFKGKAIPYVWNNLWNTQDLSYKLANAGYMVVICNVSNFYFDLAYEKHPLEPGLHWGGFVGPKQAFDFSPYDVFKSTHFNGNMGEVFTSKDAAGMEKLKPEARKNILGIQAQLWSEQIVKPELLDYQLLPKLIGFAESAWASERVWESIEPDEEREKAVDKDWNTFVNSIGLNEFKRLDYLWGGYQYRIPPAGAIIKDGLLYANTEYPGFIIRYTTSNSEPDEKSAIYTKPIRIQENVKLRVFNSLGRGSRTIKISNNKNQ